MLAFSLAAGRGIPARPEMSHARESHAGTRKGRSERRTVSGGWLQLPKASRYGNAASILKPIPAHESALLEAGGRGPYREAAGLGQPGGGGKAFLQKGRKLKIALFVAHQYGEYRKTIISIDNKAESAHIDYR